MKSPITNKNNTTLIKKINTKEIADKWKKQYSIKLSDEFLNIKTLEYWHCRDTGFYWYTPEKAAGKSNLYEQLQKHAWYYQKDKWEYLKALNLIGDTNIKILEIGSGAGFF